MEKNKEPMLESNNKGIDSGDTPVACNNGSEELEELFDEELGKTPHIESPQPALSFKVTKHLEDMANPVYSCLKRQYLQHILGRECPWMFLRTRHRRPHTYMLEVHLQR